MKQRRDPACEAEIQENQEHLIFGHKIFAGDAVTLPHIRGADRLGQFYLGGLIATLISLRVAQD